MILVRKKGHSIHRGVYSHHPPPIPTQPCVLSGVNRTRTNDRPKNFPGNLVSPQSREVHSHQQHEICRRVDFMTCFHMFVPVQVQPYPTYVHNVHSMYIKTEHATAIQFHLLSSPTGTASTAPLKNCKESEIFATRPSRAPPADENRELKFARPDYRGNPAGELGA